MDTEPTPKLTEEQLLKQIEALKEQLNQVQAAKSGSEPATPSKRKRNDTRVLATNTPSPKKRRLEGLPAVPSRKPQENAPKSTKPPRPLLPELPPPKPSNVLSNLAAIQRSKFSVKEPVQRSTTFKERSAQSPTTSVKPSCPERDDRLALVEKLEPGPIEHKPPVDDPEFQQLEPYSGIRLTSRRLSHNDLQEHFSGRYYVSPSLLYSIIRPLASNSGYDVPIPGDWITIGVIAKRGEIMFTNNVSQRDDDIEDPKDKKGKGKEKEKPEERRKRYMSIKLIDFGTRGHGPKAHIRGDALLSLLLFEADTCSEVSVEGSKRTEQIYKGGSGGAFEACMKLHEGAVIAILNPKIMKPFKRDMNAPHPTKNILAITPISAQSIAIIGQSRDLGMCIAMRRDGKICGEWCDKRISEHCEFHVENAVQRKRAGRAEFSIGTSGMTTTAKARKNNFDPDRKWGLLPDESKGNRNDRAGEGSTYVISGHIVSSSRPEYVEEKIGRERAERTKRRREEQENEKLLNSLLGREGGGGDRNAAAGAVRKAREVMKTLRDDKESNTSKEKKDAVSSKKYGFSAETIKTLGFDPTARTSRPNKVADAQSKLDILASLQKAPAEINLGPRPGLKIRSGIRVPERESISSTRKDESDSDLEIE